MKKSKISQGNNYLKLAKLWIVFCTICLVLSVICAKHLSINSSVLALLPDNTLGVLPKGVEDAFLSRLDSQLIWMVKDETPDASIAAQFADQIKKIPDISVSDKLSDAALSAWGKYYFTNRSNLLDDASKARLSGNGEQQATWMLGQIYSAFSGVSSQELVNDPLLLVRSNQIELQKLTKKMMLKNGWLYVQDDKGVTWYIIRAEIKGSSYNIHTSHQLVSAINDVKTQFTHRYPDLQILQRGTLFYSDYASQLAQKDISHLGTVTVLAVIALIIFIFRSIRPLLLCIMSVCVGGMIGALATYAIFGEIHLMTLVMSMSLIGLSVDYALYFLTQRMVHGHEENAFVTMDKIRVTLLLALTTVILAYMIIVIAPFPGLRQLAVFAASGLVASCVSVILIFPFLTKNLPVRPIPFQSAMNKWIVLWVSHDKFVKTVIGSFLVIIIISLWHLRVNDDIAAFQALPQELQVQDREITALTGQSTEQKWFIVYGSTPQETLQRVEKLNAQLTKAKDNLWITDYKKFPLPSAQTQLDNIQLVRTAMPKVIHQLADHNIDLKAVDVVNHYVTPEDWLKSEVSEGWRLAYISLPNQTTAILIPVDGVKQTAQLSQIAHQLDGVVWVDRKAQFDHLFAFYRTILTGLLAVILSVICLFYCVKFGIKRGMGYMLPTLLSLGGALSCLVLSGQTLNLFSLLALVLVLGIGINYTLFFGNPSGVVTTSFLAITLAMMTTLLTQGLLVFSATQAIQGFGIVLCGGILTAFIVSPLVLRVKNGN